MSARLSSRRSPTPEGSSRVVPHRSRVRAQGGAAGPSSGRVPSIERSKSTSQSLSARIARFLSAASPPASSDLPPRMYSRALALCREQVREREKERKRKRERGQDGEQACARLKLACALDRRSLSLRRRGFFVFFPLFFRTTSAPSPSSSASSPSSPRTRKRGSAGRRQRRGRRRRRRGTTTATAAAAAAKATTTKTATASSLPPLLPSSPSSRPASH